MPQQESPFSLSQDYQREQREQQENIRLQLANEQQQDGDEARRILAVASATGLPEEVVAASLPELEKEVTKAEFDVDKWRAESPAWASFVSENPMHMAALKEDQKNMGYMEKTLHQLDIGWDNTWYQVESGRINYKIAGGAPREQYEERLKELDKLLVANDFGATGFARFLVKNVKMSGPTLRSLGQGLEWGLGGAMAAGVSTAYAGQIGPLAGFPEEIATVPAAALTGGLVAGKAGMAMSAFELETGFAYDEYIKMGLDHDTASAAAFSVGAVNAALESFSLSVLTKYIPGIKRKAATTLVGEVFKRPTVRRATGVAIARFGEVLGTEVITEALQESVTAVTGEFIRPEGEGDELTLGRWWERISEVMVETVQGAAIMSSFGPVASYYTDTRRAFNAKNMERVFLALGEAASDSSTLKDVPKKYHEFVKQLTKDGDLEHLLIDIDRFTEYFQEKGLDPDEVAKELGIDLEGSRVNRNDLAIPVAAYAEKIAPSEHHAALSRDLKTRYDEMSARESEIWYANADEVQKIIFDGAPPEGHVQVTEIFETVRDQLVAGGIEYTAAESKATLTEAVFSTLARRNGKDPLEYFKERWGGVQRDDTEMLGKIDVDVFIDPLLDRLRTGDVPVQRDIYGESLIDFLMAKGGMDIADPELAARDVAAEFPKLLKKGGLTLEAAAELASEAGFLAEYDTDQLLEAIDQMIRGETVFGRGADPAQASLAKALDDLGDLVDQANLDLATMTNAEIRAVLRGDLVLEQLIDVIEVPGALPGNILADQEFGDLKITVDIPLAGRPGQFVGISRRAQTAFDDAVSRLRSMQDLLECFNAG